MRTLETHSPAPATSDGAVPRAGVTVGVPCRADEPALSRTLDSLGRAAETCRDLGREVDFVVCVNGVRDGVCAAVEAARAFSTDVGRAHTEVLVDDVADKARAWNRIAAASRTPLLGFCDADVAVDPGTIEALARCLDLDSGKAIATARRIPEGGHSLIARAAALPARFDMGVVSGACYVVRADAVGAMPEGLLLEDAWLSARLGRDSLAVVPSAVVRYRPPSSLRDYFRERLRTEAGKIQLRSMRDARRDREPIARYPWRTMLGELRPREWPLVVVNLAVRSAARAAAEIATALGVSVRWRSVPSSKLTPGASA